MASDTYTEVTRQSWGSRLRGSFKGIVFGLILIGVAVWLLFWNEGRAVRRAKALKEGAAAVVSVPAEQVDPAREGQLVHTTALAATDEILTDADFGIAVNALHLERTVEMYQWREHASSETKKKVGGSTETTTTYSYDQGWSERLISSSGFKQPEGHENPTSMPYQARKVSAQNVSLGAFRLSPGLISRIQSYQPLTLSSTDGLPSALRWKARLSNGGVYLGLDPTSPAVGDARVTFRYVEPTIVSVVAQQLGGSFGPYQTRHGSVELLQTGSASADAMFQSAQTSNKINTWILRVIGFLLMLFGLRAIFRPLSVLADVLPPVGNLVEAGTGMVAFFLALFASLLIIAIAWLFYRPLLAITLLALAVVIGVLLVRKLRKPRLPPLPQPGA